MKKSKTLTSILVATVLLGCAAWFFNFYRIKSMPTVHTNMPFISNSFVVGVNYPWFSYGNDFGDSAWAHTGVSTPASARAIENDFAQLQMDNVHIVRWFLWADGHAGIHFAKDGSVTGLDHDFFADVDQAIAIAKRHDIRIMFVLVDFKFFEGDSYGTDGHNWGGHDVLVTSSSARTTFLDKAVRPLAKRYAGEKTIAAWEIVNEPEWEIGPSIRWGRKSFTASQMESFIASVAACIHRYGHQPVTVGSVAPDFLPLWQNAGLDFYEAHSYPYTELLELLELRTGSLAPLHLNKPCLLGEFPTTHGSRSITAYLQKAYKDGYAGAFPWSFRAGDGYSNYQGVRDRIRHWHPR